jgi:hypothetical protein
LTIIGLFDHYRIALRGTLVHTLTAQLSGSNDSRRTKRWSNGGQTVVKRWSNSRIAATSRPPPPEWSKSERCRHSSQTGVGGKRWSNGVKRWSNGGQKTGVGGWSSSHGGDRYGTGEAAKLRGSFLWDQENSAGVSPPAECRSDFAA